MPFIVLSKTDVRETAQIQAGFEIRKQQLDKDFAQFIAEAVNTFSDHHELAKPDLVCSHGHTVFHQPEKGITVQIGDGQIIADATGITCINDFRALDVSLGGQGAPLVPIGDELLFSDFEACLNLGGFSNISFRENDERHAFDICPVNIVLNPLAKKLGLEFDRGGKIARSGNLNSELLEKLNAVSVYHQEGRPSLAREWLEQEFVPLLENTEIAIEDKLRTVTEHAAFQISRVLNYKVKSGNVLVTGGGAKNDFFMNRVRELSESEVTIGEAEIVDFKEAVIFAFLGVLRSENQINILRSVTGASRNSCSGVIHLPKD
jgi:anhydro-N-acetylmuramic acid kinase